MLELEVGYSTTVAAICLFEGLLKGFWTCPEDILHSLYNLAALMLDIVLIFVDVLG